MSPNSIAQKLIDEYAQFNFKYNPGFATFIGIHDYDHLLGQHSKQAHLDFFDQLRAWQEQLLEIDRSTLTDDEREDLCFLNQAIEIRLFTARVLALWQKHPDYCTYNISWSIDSLFQREFAPYPQRAKNIIARLNQVPKYLMEARSCVDNPVELWTRKSIASIEGIPKYYQTFVSFSKELSKELHNNLQKAATLAIDALNEHRSWLETDVLPKAGGSWVIGPDRYQEWLKIKQVSLKIPEMEAMAHRVLKDTRQQMNELVEELVPGGTIEDAQRKVKEDHPSDFDGVLKEYKRAMTATRQFLIDKKLATIPANEKLHLRETPAYLRPFIPLAAYRMPAKYDPLQEGVFWVTPPEKDGKLLEEHNYGMIGFTAIHEGYPGHHLQRTTSVQKASFAKMLGLIDWPVETNEGWALYCEWMMDEEGFAYTPAAKFEQLRNTLVRAVRVLVDIEMHSGRMSVEEVAVYLEREAYMEKSRALMEAEMYTTMPTYFTGYLVGAHLIKELRERCQAHQGNQFDKCAFHDLLLSSSFLTISAVEGKMQQLDWLATSR